ncbi:MAG: hypothetical protein H0T62_10460 [Parachlamydiaceae bacterium]|nr:hypothetical protein [Parachlamydiaceae bacterium]
MKILKPFFYSLLVILCSGEFSPLSSIEDSALNIHDQKFEIMETVSLEGIVERDGQTEEKPTLGKGTAEILIPAGNTGSFSKAKSYKPAASHQLSFPVPSTFENLALDETGLVDANDEEIALSYPELHFSNNLLPDLVDIICEGDAKGSIKNGKAYLSSNEDGKVTLLSKAVVDGAQGQNASCIIAARFGRGNAGTQQFLGIGNDADGLFFKLIDSTFVILYKTNHEEVVISQSNWSIDPVDGTGLSDLIFDYTKCHIFKIQSELDFSKINFYIESSLTGKFVLVHQIDSTSGYPARSLPDHSLQLMAQVVNGPSQLKVSSMNLFVDGNSVFSNPKNTLDTSESFIEAPDLNLDIVKVKFKG